MEERSKGKKIKKTEKGVAVQRSEASQNISEFDLNEVGKERVQLEELLKASKKLCTVESVRKQLHKSKKSGSLLPVPLSRPQVTKIKRKSAYEKVCGELSRWDGVVRTNRTADQLVLPLRNPQHEKDGDKLEVRLLRGEVMRHRALVSYQVARTRRQNKIKSKRYHRMLKHEKLKKMARELEDAGKAEAAAALRDRLRILERMTLKHKNTGKWAKLQKLRAKYDPEARSALREDRQVGRLLEKVEGGRPSEGRTLSDEETQSADRKWRDAPRPKSVVPEDFGHVAEETILESIQSRNLIDVVESEEDEAVNISEAFADESVDQEFREEKRASEEVPQGVDTYLPGWGRWGGTSIVDSKRKRRCFFRRATLEQGKRQHTIESVILCDQKNDKLDKHLVRQVPFPFSSSRQFESFVRQPVCHTWNPMSSVQCLVAPRVRTRLGQAIPPLADDYNMENGGPVTETQNPSQVSAF